MENKIPKKRQRSENWLEEDRHLLTELVRERADSIENKNTDTNTNSKKVSAWVDLLSSFNSMSKGGPRTLPQLKSQWGIIKMKERNKQFTERKEVKKTGGGPPPKMDPPNADDIVSWLPEEFHVPTNITDSDEYNKENIEESFPEITNLGVQEKCFLVNEVPDIVMEEVVTVQVHQDKNIEEINSSVIEYKQDELVQEQRIVSAAKLTPCGRLNENNHKNKNKPKTSAERITVNEIECRRELHQAQLKYEKELHDAKMENEIKLSRNLDLEYEIIKKKRLCLENENKQIEK